MPIGVAPNQPSAQGKVGRLLRSSVLPWRSLTQLLFATFQSASKPDPVTFTAMPGEPKRTVSPVSSGGSGAVAPP
jgi:hypothetical protein